eukprot:SAG31_NODE_22475_length_524_cov_1.884706_1_plen_95_part_10
MVFEDQMRLRLLCSQGARYRQRRPANHCRHPPYRLPLPRLPVRALIHIEPVPPIAQLQQLRRHAVHPALRRKTSRVLNRNSHVIKSMGEEGRWCV